MSRRARAQPQDVDVELPARVLHVRHRRLGLGQEHAGQRHPLPRAGADAHGARVEPGAHDALEGSSTSTRSIDIDQSPDRPHAALQPGHLHRALHADPRAVRAAAGSARARLQPGPVLASTSRAGAARPARATASSRSRCTSCPTSTCTCEICDGKRYNRETLEIRYKGQSIADVLDMTVEEALEFFEAVPQIATSSRRWRTSGSATSSSASRRRRSRAARRSASSWPRSCRKRATGRTLYILDEPTTGLHFDDVEKLLDVLHRWSTRATR